MGAMANPMIATPSRLAVPNGFHHRSTAPASAASRLARTRVWTPTRLAYRPATIRPMVNMAQ